jgi:antirestriction protein ArdC
METKTIRKDVYEIVTSIIIEKLETGIIPWKQPWKGTGAPMNLISKKPYRGLNILLLSYHGYSSNYFLTFKQLLSIGGRVKKGEKSHLVVFWKWDPAPEENEAQPPQTEEQAKRQAPILRYYHVFNTEQCEGIPAGHLSDLLEVPDNDPIAACEELVGNMPQRPDIRFKYNEAFYHPLLDYVNMPKMERFDDSESYYHILFHELIHSTGHDSRLCRKFSDCMEEWGSEAYSFEELIAEIGSNYLDAIAGISSPAIDNSIAYIQGWLSRLKGDKRFIIDAACKAQRAVDFILGNYLESIQISEEDRKMVLEHKEYFREQ